MIFSRAGWPANWSFVLIVGRHTFWTIVVFWFVRLRTEQCVYRMLRCARATVALVDLPRVDEAQRSQAVFRFDPCHPFLGATQAILCAENHSRIFSSAWTRSTKIYERTIVTILPLGKIDCSRLPSREVRLYNRFFSGNPEKSDCTIDFFSGNPEKSDSPIDCCRFFSGGGTSDFRWKL